MAITFVDDVAWSSAASGSVTLAMAGVAHAAGDIIIARVGYKSSAIATCDASTATSGWAKVGEFHDGTTNSGNGTGSVAVAAFWKEATSGSEPDMVIDFSQAVTQVGWTGLSYRKGAGETWDTPVGDGGGFTAATNISATIQSHVSVTSGDMVDFFYSARDDSTSTVPTITQTDVTFGTVVEQPAAALASTVGADGTYDGGHRLATAGTSSAAAVVTGTLSTSESGSAWMTRLRVFTAAARVPRFTSYPQLLAH